MMDLESLRCFVAVAETCHFGAAARRVALSPAAFSERVRGLEGDLGAELLLRSSRRVHLTEAGRRLLPHARRLLEDAARCASLVHGPEVKLPFELTVGTRYELGLSWLVPQLAGLSEARPERTVHLAMGDTDALLDGLERGRLDAAVLSARLARPHLRYALLHEERYVFVGLPGAEASAEAAATGTLIDVSPDLPLFRYLADALPDFRPWRFARYRYLGGTAGIRHQVLAGVGVAVLPRYFVEADLAEGRLVDLLPDVVLPSDWFRLVWRAGHPREGELEGLAGELRGRALG